MSIKFNPKFHAPIIAKVGNKINTTYSMKQRKKVYCTNLHSISHCIMLLVCSLDPGSCSHSQENAYNLFPGN